MTQMTATIFLLDVIIRFLILQKFDIFHMELIMCLPCMADYLDVTEEDLLAKIEEFKQEGCKLFS